MWKNVEHKFQCGNVENMLETKHTMINKEEDEEDVDVQLISI